MSVLPEFSFDHVIEPRTAKQDKIEIVVSLPTYYGEPEDFDAFRHYLGGPPAGIEAGGVFSLLFNRPETSRAYRKPLQLRKSRRGSVSQTQPPLFQGNFRLAPIPFELDHAVAASAELRLSLNPTRFLAYQDAEGYIPRLDRRVGSQATFFRRPAFPATHEVALDNNDNWLPDTPQFERLHDWRLWNRVVRDYIHGTLALINTDIERARTRENVPVEISAPADVRPFNLRSVETYFDYHCSDPVRAVLDLELLLESFSDQHLEATDYRISVPGWRRNSRCLTLPLKRGVHLKIYAKTDKRIRFEVRHDLTKADLRESSIGGGRHTFSSLNNVYQRLDDLSRDAADQVNHVFAHLRNRASIPATDKTTIDLLFDVAQALGARYNARLIIGTLCYKGSISSSGTVAPALRRLKSAGILRTQDRNSRQEYVVTEAYKHPLQMLQQHGSFPHLTTRKRVRYSNPPAA